MDRTRAAESPGPTVIRTARMSASAAFNEPPGIAAAASRPPRNDSFHSLSHGLPHPLDIAHARASAQPSNHGQRALRSRLVSSPSPLDVAQAAFDSSPVRRSTRKRKAPELLTTSSTPDDHRPRKRKATPEESASKPAAKKRAPARLKTDPDEEEADDPNDNNCCICMTEPEPEELATINGCEHHFCFGCIEKWADRENTCPLCKKRFVTIDRVQKPTRQKGVRTPKNSVKVKNKSQRSEMTHSLALEGLFGDLGRNGIAIESFFARLGGHRSFNTQIARIVVGGLGSGLELGGPPPRAASSASAARRDSSSDSAAAAQSSTRIGFARAPPEMAARLEAAGVPSISVSRGFFAGFGSDGEDSDDDDGFSGFMDAVRSSRAFSFSSLPVAMHSLPPARSFASNMHDASAGGSAENALEIEDDSDDDEVEIVGTARPRSHRSRGM